MMRPILTPMLLLCNLTDCAQAPRPASELILQIRCEEVDSSNKCDLWGPSLVDLIARPEAFDGKRVRVMGFVNFEFEGNGLYLSREDWQQGIDRNGVWIDPPLGFDSDSGPVRAVPNQRYVIVEGTFRATHRGHMGMWSGAIEQVTRLNPWPPTVLPTR